VVVNNQNLIMKKTLIVLTILLASNNVFAYVDCRENINGCSIEQLVSLCQSSPNGNLDKVSACKSAISKIQERVDYLANAVPMNDVTCQQVTNKLWIGKTDADTNGDVSRVQNFLKKLGYINYDVDGRFGTWDKRAVWKFQEDNMKNISPTGDIGKLTLAKINSMICSTTETYPKVTWKIEKTNPSITDINNYKRDEQTVFITVIFGDGSQKNAKVGNAYGCSVADKTKSSQDAQKRWLSGVNCYYALTGTTFDAYSNLQNGKIIVQSQAEDGIGQKPAVTVLEF